MKDKSRTWRLNLQFEEIAMEKGVLVYVTSRTDGIWMVKVDLSIAQQIVDNVSTPKKRKH